MKKNLLSHLIYFGKFVLKAILVITVIIAIGIGGLKIYWAFPIHQVSVHCYDFQVYFEGPKNQKYIEVMSNEIRKLGAPVKIKDDRVFTTGAGTRVDQVSKVIMYGVRPEWFRDPPTFEKEKEKILVERWKNRTRLSTDDKHKSWCHLLEAAIAKNGVDIEARRNNPRVLPRDKFPIPVD